MTRAAARAYGVLWLITGSGAALAPLGIHFIHVGSPSDALLASADTAAGLLVHNALVALWPLGLAALGWASLRRTRQVGDVLVSGQLLLHGVLVGNAVGQVPGLWRYLPHLPFEWLGIAVPVAGWRLARQSTAAAPVVRRTALGALGALAVAACLETWAVPL